MFIVVGVWKNNLCAGPALPLCRWLLYRHAVSQFRAQEVQLLAVASAQLEAYCGQLQAAGRQAEAAAVDRSVHRPPCGDACLRCLGWLVVPVRHTRMEALCGQQGTAESLAPCSTAATLSGPQVALCTSQRTYWYHPFNAVAGACPYGHMFLIF